MVGKTVKYLSAAALASAVSFSAPAVAGESFKDAVASGKVLLDVRYTYETVDQDGFANDAQAHTLRTRLGYETGDWNGMKFLVDFDHIQNFFGDKFNSLTNGQTTYPVVVDPDTTELNRAQITWAAAANTTFIIGRQRVHLDNQRFVGSVPWRQNEQTFDAAVVATTIIPGTTLIYGYVPEVHTIRGDDHPVGDIEGNNHLFNLAFNKVPFGKFSTYAYYLDLDNPALWGLSAKTYGARFVAGHKTETGKFKFQAEYARQSDHGDNPASFELDYMLLDAALQTDMGLGLGGGIEILEGNGLQGFQTPLATGHKFQGFADVFLTTPAAGVEDKYISASWKFSDKGFMKKPLFKVWYHAFDSNVGSMDMGSEVDAIFKFKFCDGYSFIAKYSDYDGAGYAADRQKLTIQIGFKY